MPLLDRLWKLVSPEPNTGCWLWVGATQRSGYGIVKVAGCICLAHRAVYAAVVGPVPDGLELDHLCRHRGCVNPAHLEPVTRAENVRRASKLTAAAVATIRSACAAGASRAAVAKQFAVSTMAVGAIVRGDRWAVL